MCEIYFDGSKKKDGIGFSVVIYDDSYDKIFEETHTLKHQDLTSNSAEYLGLILALSKAISLNIKKATVFGDSQLIIKQMLGEFEAKAPHIKAYNYIARSLLVNFDDIKFVWIPREQNQEADRISRG